MCSKALQSDDRLLCDIEISGKTQNYRLKSVCNFKVTRFYLILPCNQHNWTSGTYSIEISTWSCENRVSKHFVIFLNFPCLIACCVRSTRTQPLICVGCSLHYWVSCAINKGGFFKIAFLSSTHICLALRRLLTFCLTLTR